MPQIAIHQNCIIVNVKRKFAVLYSFFSVLGSILESEKLIYFQICKSWVHVELFMTKRLEIHITDQEGQPFFRTPHGVTDFVGVFDIDGGFEVQVKDKVCPADLPGISFETFFRNRAIARQINPCLLIQLSQCSIQGLLALFPVPFGKPPLV